MKIEYWYLIIGIAIGWITKVPFLIKWYKELAHHKDMVAKLIDIDIALCRDCWSAACASGYKNFPSLSAMQKDFDEWLIEHKITK